MSDALSTRLLLSRRDLKLNQDDLARRAGVSRAYISDLERSKVENPTADVIIALATALGVRPEYLMGWSDDPLGESRPASISEGRVVYQVGSPAEYRLVQEMLELFTELSAENQRILLQLADQLRRANHARVVE